MDVLGRSIPVTQTPATISTSEKRSTARRRKRPKLTMEDLGRSESDPDFVLSEKYSYCLMLEQLEMADRFSELSCTRATEFAEEQLSFVSKLQAKRLSLTKPPTSHRSFQIWLRRAIKNPTDETLACLSDDEDGPDASPKWTVMMEEALRASVLRAALEYTKEEIIEQFDKHIRKRGLDDEELKTLEEILGGPGAKDLYCLMAKNNMFKPEDSLRRLHKSGQTVHHRQLFAELENNQDIPVMNILEWKQTTIEKLMKQGIDPKEVDPCKVDWELVAHKMEKYGYKFSPEQWFDVWSVHIDESIPYSDYVKKRIPELVHTLGRDWEAISKALSPEYSPDACRTIYYDSLCDMGTFDTRTPPWRILRKALCRLGQPAEEIYKQLGRSFPKMAELLNDFLPTVALTYNELKQQVLDEERIMRMNKMKYSDIEDALLLVTVTQLKPIIQVKGFSYIKSYLPWRPVSEWRHRLRMLARQWFNARLTMQEDMKLIYLANLLPSRWVEISGYFDGYDRKFCRGHYVTLHKHLSRGETLLDYHARNGSKRISLSFPYIKRIAKFLFAFITKDCQDCVNENTIEYEERRLTRTRTIKCRVVRANRKGPTEFTGFKNSHLPSSEELRSLLFSIGKEWIIQTCKELVATIKTIGTASRPLPELALKRSRMKSRRRSQPVLKVEAIEAKGRPPLVECDLDSDSCYVTEVNTNPTPSTSSECSSSSTNQVSQDSSFPHYSIGWVEPINCESPEFTGSTIVPTPPPSRKRISKSTQDGKDGSVGPKSSKPPKPKKPAGRKSGRLSKLRREVALARWHKTEAKAISSEGVRPGSNKPQTQKASRSKIRKNIQDKKSQVNTKPRKPAGRKSGRISKLRREAAMTRWRKSKETKASESPPAEEVQSAGWSWEFGAKFGISH